MSIHQNISLKRPVVSGEVTEFYKNDGEIIKRTKDLQAS